MDTFSPYTRVFSIVFFLSDFRQDSFVKIHFGALILLFLSEQNLYFIVLNRDASKNMQDNFDIVKRNLSLLPNLRLLFSSPGGGAKQDQQRKELQPPQQHICGKNQLAEIGEMTKVSRWSYKFQTRPNVV